MSTKVHLLTDNETMKTILLLSALTLGTFFFTEEQPKRQTIETATKIDFTFDLFRTLAAAKPDDNITVSPYGAERLLDFVRSGSAGETKTQIDAVLGDTVLGGAVSDGPEPGSAEWTASTRFWPRKSANIISR